MRLDGTDETRVCNMAVLRADDASDVLTAA